MSIFASTLLIRVILSLTYVSCIMLIVCSQRNHRYMDILNQLHIMVGGWVVMVTTKTQKKT